MSQHITQVVAGSINQANMSWTLKVNASDVVSPQVTWELIDRDGRVYNKGDGGAVEINPHATRPGVMSFKSYATIQIPSNVPVNGNGSQFQINWMLTLKKGVPPVASVDNLTIMPPQYQHLGAIDIVDQIDSNTEIMLRTPAPAESINLRMYRNNEQLAEYNLTSSPEATADGYLYRVPVTPSSWDSVHASLVPLSAVWRYTLPGVDAPLVENSSLWMVNPSIMTAMKDVDAFVNRVYIDSGINPGTTFTPVDLVRHLRKGMDSFNSYIRPTNFTMVNAQGGIRQMWQMLSIIDACRTQYLVEGAKAFNFAGQAVTLDVDRTQFWDNVANQLQQEVDSNIKMLKDNLAKMGIVGGDGQVIGPRQGSIGAIGIALSPITPLRQGYYRYNNGAGGVL